MTKTESVIKNLITCVGGVYAHEAAERLYDAPQPDVPHQMHNHTNTNSHEFFSQRFHVFH